MLKHLYTLSGFYSTPTLVSPLFVTDTFGFSFCQRLWDLTKRRDNIAVTVMVADMAADIEVHMVADMEVDKVADMAAVMEVNKVADTVADMEVDKV